MLPTTPPVARLQYADYAGEDAVASTASDNWLIAHTVNRLERVSSDRMMQTLQKTVSAHRVQPMMGYPSDASPNLIQKLLI